ncbi:MAG: 50S ribosomal protein L24 [Thermoplasmata archaeon]
MTISPRSPRRQRRLLYRASPTERRRRMTVPLSRELRARFHRRSIPLRKGDTVRVLRGSFEGREERVASVDRRSLSVVLDNVTVKTGESKQTALPIRPASLVIVRLNLADPWRRRELKVTDEELTPEERGETPVPAEPPTAAAPPTGKDEPAAPSEETGEDEVEEGGPGEDDEEEEDEPETAPPPRRSSAGRSRAASPASPEEP